MHKNLYLHFLFNRCTSMLTGVWHARLRRDIGAVWGRGAWGPRGFALGNAVMLLMNRVKDLLIFYFVLFLPPRGCVNATLRRWIFARPETNSFSVPHLLSAAPRAVYASVTLTGSQQTKGEKKSVNKNSTTLYLPFKKKMPIFICFEEDKHTSDN